MSTKKQSIARFYATAASLGLSMDEADALRRIEMTLHRWAELECGANDGHITRDEATQVPYRHYGNGSGPFLTVRCADREAGALRRLAKLMARHPELVSYHQGDPRGCALYILRKADVPAGAQLDAVYSRGWAVCY